MSVSIIDPSELATIAAFAHGCDDPFAALALLSAANVAAYNRQYGESETPETVATIAVATVKLGSGLEDAARVLSLVAYNCVTNAGTDMRRHLDAHQRCAHSCRPRLRREVRDAGGARRLHGGT